jgi:uncharacterized protein HemY
VVPDENIATLLKYAVKNMKDSPGRQYVLQTCGKIHYKHKEYGNCVAAFNDARKYTAKGKYASDESLEFMEAMSLIYLDNTKSATKLLTQLGESATSTEDRARALFLTGWIYLRQNNGQEAKKALEKAISADPNGPYAGKAKTYVDKLMEKYRYCCSMS